MDFELTKHFLKIVWQSIQIDNRTFLFKSIFELDNYEILLFDLDKFKLFYLKNNESEIRSLFKKLNPKSESPIETLVDHLNKNFNSSSELRFAEESNDEKMIVKFTGMYSGQKNFNWLFEFSAVDSIQIRDHILVPLLFNMTELQQREKDLVEIVKQKDKEIDDYRSQGCTLTRGYLSTNFFDSKTFEENLSNKKDNDALQNPLRIMQTDFVNKIGSNCINKYYRDYFRLDQVKENDNEQNSNENLSTQNTQASQNNKHKLERLPSQDESSKKLKEQAEREERERKLQKELEEASKKKSKLEQNKKKKLMK